jgi:hypothetical protein
MRIGPMGQRLLDDSFASMIDDHGLIIAVMQAKTSKIRTTVRKNAHFDYIQAKNPGVSYV